MHALRDFARAEIRDALDQFDGDGLTSYLGAVAGILALVALLASLLPTYRAAQVDPLEVLRAN